MSRGLKWLAIGLAVAGIAVLLAIAAVANSPLLTFAVIAAILVLLLPLAAYFMFRRGRTENR